MDEEQKEQLVREQERIKEQERIERERQEEEDRRKREEEKAIEDYIADKHCAYCTHLIPDKREGRAFYCDKLYTYVSGTQKACREYGEAGRSSLVSDLIFSDQYGFEADEKDCAFCTHLIPDKKSEGRYYCDYLKTYVKGNDSNKTMKCSNFEESGRSNLQCEVIRDDSERIDSHTESMISKKYCCDCNFYDVNDKKGEGYYTCTKRNQPVSANQPECYMFENSGRSSKENEKLYDEALEASKKSDSKDSNGSIVSFLLLILLAVILAIASFIIK